MADEPRVESQGFYEMLWDCDHCDTKGLLGKSQRHCPECGAKQNADKRYFPKEGDKQQRVDGHKYEGSDRHCPSCNAAVSSKGNNCPHCGAPQDGAKEVKGVAAAPKPAPKKRRWWIPVLIILLVIGFFGVIWYACFRTKAVKMTVSAHNWACTIDIEKYGDVQKENWAEQVPVGVDKRCSPKQKSTKQVQDGEICVDEKVDKKDGTFEVLKKCKPKMKSVGIDGDWCTYSVRDWVRVDERSSSGSGTSISCPTDVPPVNVTEQVGATRAGTKHEKRMLKLGSQTCEVSADSKWKKYADGAQVTVEVRASSGEIVCSSL